MKSDTAHPTAPSKGTASAGGIPSVLAIRWLFPDTRGRLSRLSADQLRIGRGEGCEIDLAGEETSRRHAEIIRDGAVSVIKDVGSTNGVFLNGVQMKEATLVPGQVLRLGAWIGVVIAVTSDVAEANPVFELFAPNLAGGPVIRSIIEKVRCVATSDLPVVVLGETGTGKEGLARAVHAWSGRRGPFVAVNCAALMPSLAEAELFGYRKGAFTGAVRDSPGLFRSAEAGTLLLDEITDLPGALQPKLLRVLQEREVLPLGESRPVRIDVRVVVATQVPLTQAVAEGRFRADLCGRLDAVSVRLPPLRERKEEIPYLFSHLLGMHSGGRSPAVEPRLIEQLCLYDWPFNVRELDLLTRSLLVVHAHEGTLRRSFLPDRVLVCPNSGRSYPGTGTTGRSARKSLPGTPEARRARSERDFDLLREGLCTNGGILARAAAAAGISRQRAYRLLKTMGTGNAAIPGTDQDDGETEREP
jgi:transcriptional regulator with PAS, ATPase and Fis domain